MKTIKFLIILLFVFNFFIMLSCDRSATSSEETINPIDLTPRENAEAEEAALFLSKELMAPQELYEKVLDGFNLLRKKYADSIPEVNIAFNLPISASYFKMGISDSAAMELRSNNYYAWDSLNTYYNISIFDTISLSWEFYVWLKSDGRFNQYEICDIYENLPGVNWTFPGYYGEDRSSTYPWIDSTGNLTFLVRKAWGDCPSGCMESHYYYFKMESGEINYIGDWEWSYPQPPQPDWWDEASIAPLMYYYYPNDPPEKL